MDAVFDTLTVLILKMKLSFRINQLMRKYCDEAMTYGNVGEPVTAKQKKVLVILNPVADKKSAAESVRFS